MKYQKDEEIIEIVQEETPENPREWDNLGTMACFHNNYDLGDKQTEIDKEDYGSWDEMEAELNKRALIVIKLRLYDHSGITISASTGYPYNCRWDSGTVGFIYVTAKKIKEMYGVKRITKKTMEKVRAALMEEIKTYDQYITGEIYGFKKYKMITCKTCSHQEEEFLDSCYGFYGSDFKENGLLEQAGIDNLDEWETIDDDRRMNNKLLVVIDAINQGLIPKDKEQYLLDLAVKGEDIE